MGSGFRTFATSEVLTGSNVQNYLMEQTVMSFASTGARDAALTSPETGMVAYIRSNDANEGFHTYSSASTWRKGPGWNAPWGAAGYATLTTAPSASSAKTNTGLSITTGTIPTNRILKHTVTGMVFFNSVNDMARISIVTGSTGGTDLMEADFAPFGTTYAYTVSFSFYETTTSTAALTRRITQERINGTSSTIQFFCDATRPATYIIEDIGPSGAPV
jgi:hypothetical protein